MLYISLFCSQNVCLSLFIAFPFQLPNTIVHFLSPHYLTPTASFASAPTLLGSILISHSLSLLLRVTECALWSRIWVCGKRERDREMGVDLRQVVAGILTVTMFVMLGHMIKRDHFDYVEVSPQFPLLCFTYYGCI